jgi:predicted alpha/beta superfamily hydrolase
MELPIYPFRWLTSLFLVVAFQAHSQNIKAYTYPSSEVVTIHSKLLNEERKVYVHYPKVDSADVNKRFPVVYVMDGDNHFELLAQYVDYLSRPDVLAMPKTIVIGIPNTKRTRDLTQPTAYLITRENQTVVRIQAAAGTKIFCNSLRPN